VRASQIARDIEAVLAFEHQIEYDKIDLRRVDGLLHLHAAFDGNDPIAHAAQVVLQQLANVGVVVDNEYVVHREFLFCVARDIYTSADLQRNHCDRVRANTFHYKTALFQHIAITLRR
jgi:hypothetical protein